MKKEEKISLKLDKETHTYTDEQGKVYISTTQLLSKYNITPDYSSIPQQLVEAAQKKGTLIHSEVEEWIKDGIQPLTDEAVFIASYFAHQRTEMESEVMVYSTTSCCYAGTIDIVRHNTDGTVSLYDIKTGTLNKDAVAWQLTLYAKAYEERNDVKVQEIACIHCKSGQTFRVIPLDFISGAKVDALLEAELNGKEFNQNCDITEQLTKNQIDVIREFIALKKEYKQIETQYNAIVDEIEKQMEEHDIKTATTLDGLLTITRIPSTVRTSIDAKKLQKEQPDIYAQYLKTSEVKASVRVTINEDEEK